MKNKKIGILAPVVFLKLPLIRQINNFTGNGISLVFDVIRSERQQVWPCIGNIDILNNWKKPLSVAIAIANTVHLKTVSRSITNQFVDFPNIIAPNVNIFDKEAFQIGIGNIIFFGCRLSCDVGIGDFNLFNGAVSLGHDVKMGSYNIVQPSVRISGNCIVGDNNFFGVQSIVLQGLKIGNNTKIGALSVVMRNTSDNASYFGNPAKKLKY